MFLVFSFFFRQKDCFMYYVPGTNNIICTVYKVNQKESIFSIDTMKFNVWRIFDFNLLLRAESSWFIIRIFHSFRSYFRFFMLLPDKKKSRNRAKVKREHEHCNGNGMFILTSNRIHSTQQKKNNLTTLVYVCPSVCLSVLLFLNLQRKLSLQCICFPNCISFWTFNVRPMAHN